MRTLALAALLALADPWPQRGDTVYVASSLQWSFIEALIFSASPTIETIPACVPLSFVKHQPKKSRTLVRAKGGHAFGGQRDFELIGPWSERIHATEAACDEQYLRLGDPPKLIRSASRNEIPDEGRALDK